MIILHLDTISLGGTFAPWLCLGWKTFIRELVKDNGYDNIHIDPIFCIQGNQTIFITVKAQLRWGIIQY